MPEVSIILVNWNANRFLVNCIRSLLNDATSPEIEIILVDNGSTDGGPEAVEALFPSVTVIRNGKNLGFAKANNVGIRASSGRYVCLVNTDVEVKEGCLRDLVAYMDAEPKIGVAGPQLLNADSTIQMTCGRYPTRRSLLIDALALQPIFPNAASKMFWEWGHDDTRRVPMVCGAFFMVRREAMDQVGLLDEGFFFYGEECDWCKRFWEAGWEVGFYTGAQAYHFQAGSSTMSPIRFEVEFERSRLYYWRKHYGLLGRAYSFTVIMLHHSLRFIGRSVGLLAFPARRKEMKLKCKASAACLSYLFGMWRPA